MEYPQDVLAAIVRLWDPNTPGGIPVALPPQPQVLAVLEALFGASLMTEESQRYKHRVVLADHATLHQTGDVSVAAFDLALPFSAGEIIKLAPAYDPTRSALGVRANNAGALEIWSIVDFGLEGERLRLREVHGAMEPPWCLYLSSEEPGHILAKQGSRHMVELKRGEFIPAAQHFLADVVVGDFFNAAMDDLAGQRQAMGAPADAHLRPQAGNLYRSVLSIILFRIRELRRGGIVVLLSRPPANAPDDPLGRMLFKYRAGTDHAWNALLATDLDRSDNWAEILDAAKFYGDLGGIDGALILNDRFTLQGFGAKLVPPPAPELVNVIDRSNGNRPKPMAAFGTRHASSARFCWATPSALLFVVSEDGPIRMFRRVGNELHFWPSLYVDQDLL